MPDENHPSWRPQDANGRRGMPPTGDHRDWQGHDDRNGMGQSGAGAGRQSNDRSLDFQAHHQSYGGAYDEDPSRGDDDRWTGRGGSQQDRFDIPHMQRTPYGSAPGQGHYGLQGNGGNYGNYGNYGPQSGFAGGGYNHGNTPGNFGAQGGRDDARVSHRGKGPSSYQRTDERLREAICEALTEHDEIDATHIEVSVNDGVATLTGTIEDRKMKRAAEDVTEAVSGVKDIENKLRVGGAEHASAQPSAASRGQSSTSSYGKASNDTDDSKKHRA